MFHVFPKQTRVSAGAIDMFSLPVKLSPIIIEIIPRFVTEFYVLDYLYLPLHKVL
jgi:hypothetical protein